MGKSSSVAMYSPSKKDVYVWRAKDLGSQTIEDVWMASIIDEEVNEIRVYSDKRDAKKMADNYTQVFLKEKIVRVWTVELDPSPHGRWKGSKVLKMFYENEEFSFLMFYAPSRADLISQRHDVHRGSNR